MLQKGIFIAQKLALRGQDLPEMFSRQWLIDAPPPDFIVGFHIFNNEFISGRSACIFSGLDDHRIGIGHETLIPLSDLGDQIGDGEILVPATVDQLFDSQIFSQNNLVLDLCGHSLSRIPCQTLKPKRERLTRWFSMDR